tara:strand:+ start:500 stop:655 length:156 start_codon:yes stop_codon:yes gene_type:complete
VRDDNPNECDQAADRYRCGSTQRSGRNYDEPNQLGPNAYRHGFNIAKPHDI